MWNTEQALHLEAGIDEDEKTNKEFLEKPDNEVVIMATNLARPDGFAKTLITGSLATSEELQKYVGVGFVRTHRGHYFRFPQPRHPKEEGSNDYLSFQVGLPQRLYSQPSVSIQRDWRGGLGVSMIAQSIVNNPHAVIRYGNLGLKNIVEKLHGGSELERKLISMRKDELREYDKTPPLEDLTELVQIARRYGFLDEERDQAEVNITKSENLYPRVSLSETIILIPANSKESMTRLVQIKLNECKKFAGNLKNMFGVDVTELTAVDIINRYPNIYWYPQSTIALATKYLSIHPNVVNNIINSSRL